MVESGGTPTVLLVGAMIGLVGLAVLVFVGTLVYLRSQDRKKKGPSAVATRQQTAKRQPAFAKDTPANSPMQAPALTTQPGEVMRVFRDPESGRVHVMVENRRYEHIREIEDAQVGRRVLWAIADLIRFTGGMATNPRAVRSAAQDVAWDEDAQSAAPHKTTAWSAPPPTTSGPGTGAPSPVHIGQTMSEFFRRGLSPAPSTGAPPQPSSFIDQIEAILQARLRSLDQPLPHEVHVSAGPEQRLQIRVGREVYGSIDEVPDPKVRACIQAAVNEWEQR